MQFSPKQHRNANQWRHIAYFLAGFRPCTSSSLIAFESAAPANVKRSAVAGAAGLQALPDGNHGDNKRLIK